MGGQIRLAFPQIGAHDKVAICIQMPSILLDTQMVLLFVHRVSKLPLHILLVFRPKMLGLIYRRGPQTQILHPLATPWSKHYLEDHFFLSNAPSGEGHREAVREQFHFSSQIHQTLRGNRTPTSEMLVDFAPSIVCARPIDSLGFFTSTLGGSRSLYSMGRQDFPSFPLPFQRVLELTPHIVQIFRPVMLGFIHERGRQTSVFFNQTAPTTRWHQDSHCLLHGAYRYKHQGQAKGNYTSTSTYEISRGDI